MSRLATRKPHSGLQHAGHIHDLQFPCRRTAASHVSWNAQRTMAYDLGLRAREARLFIEGLNFGRNLPAGSDKWTRLMFARD